MEIGKAYLCQLAYNSKKITWEPCILLEETDEHYVVRFLETGSTKRTKKEQERLAKTKGSYCFVKDSALREITQTWLDQEAARVESTRKALHEQERVLAEAQELRGKV